jgi:hypothetical protein
MGPILLRYSHFFNHLIVFDLGLCRIVLDMFGPVLPSVVRHCRTFQVPAVPPPIMGRAR